MALAADLRDFVEDRELGPSILVGHSLGGRAAMAAALHYPGVVDSLMVVDMSPASEVQLEAKHDPACEENTEGDGVRRVGLAMREMPTEAMQTRKTAKAFLAERFENEMVVEW